MSTLDGKVNRGEFPEMEKTKKYGDHECISATIKISQELRFVQTVAFHGIQRCVTMLSSANL